MIKTKTQAIDLFGSRRALYEAMGVTAGALSQWPEELTDRQVMKVIGAAVQVGLLEVNTPPAVKAVAAQ